MKANVSQIELQKIWGRPDKTMNKGNAQKLVFYYTALNEFAFRIDRNGMVIFNYMENF